MSMYDVYKASMTDPKARDRVCTGCGQREVQVEVTAIGDDRKRLVCKSCWYTLRDRYNVQGRYLKGAL